MNFQGTTPLHEAVSKGHLDGIKLLLCNGALMDIKDNNGLGAWGDLKVHFFVCDIDLFWKGIVETLKWLHFLLIRYH